MKLILTVRDKAQWAQSYKRIVRVAFVPAQRPFVWFHGGDVHEFYHEVMMNVPTNGHPDKYNDIATLEAGMEAWNKFVMDTVPPERLLVFNVKDGWEPLCAFLGRPVPTDPFPHINDRVVINTSISLLAFVTWIWPLLLLSPLVALYYCCCVRRRPPIVWREHDNQRRTKANTSSKKQS